MGEEKRGEAAIEVTTKRLKEILKEVVNLPADKISGEVRTKIALQATEKMLKTIEEPPSEWTVKHWGPIFGHDTITIPINKRCGPRVKNSQESTMDVHAQIVRIDGEQSVKILPPGEQLTLPVSIKDYAWATVTGLGESSKYAFGTVEW